MFFSRCLTAASVSFHFSYVKVKKKKKKKYFDNHLPVFLLGCYYFKFQIAEDWEKVFPFSTQISWHTAIFFISQGKSHTRERMYEHNLQLLWDDKYHDETKEISH